MFNWHWSSFDKLTSEQLYAVLQLRSEVFVVEQACAYQDIDGLDQAAWHLLGLRDQQLVAYSRVYCQHGVVHVGRIVITQTERGSGLGRELVRQSLQGAADYFPDKVVQLSGQLHLQAFYESLGFSAIREPHDEDGIPHVLMQLNA